MKFLDKLGLALFSIIVLVISIVLCLIAFGWMESTIFSILIGKVLISQTYTYVMVAVCVLLILLAIRCIFFGDQKEEEQESDNGILLQNEDGKLLITVETLKNMTQSVINEFPNITDSATGVVITKENNVIINVSIDVTNNTVIKEISSKLQVKIKKAIKDAADLELQAVNVRVRNAEITTYDLEEDESVVKEEVKAKEEKKEENKEKEKVVKQAKATVKKAPEKGKKTNTKKSK